MGVRGTSRHEERADVFTRIFEEYWARVRHHIECVLDDDDEVSDLVSEVFSLAWLKLDMRQPLGLIWLLRVADNKLKDRERKLRSETRVVEALRRRSSAEASDVLDAIAVRHAIDIMLTPREKHVIALFYWDRLAAGEIAEVLQCSQSVVFTTLSRARAKLMRQLDVPEPPIARATNTLQTD